MNTAALTPSDRVLILGGSGFVGKRLITELAHKNIKLRLLVRDLGKAAPLMVKGADIEVVQGDCSVPLVLKRPSAVFTPPTISCTPWAARPCSRTKCTRKRTALPRRTSLRLRTQRDSNGSFYLGGLGETNDNHSEHLQSRAEIAQIISSGKPAATMLRAAVIIGAEGASYEMLRYLVESMPVMITPKWVETRIQPIAIRDVLVYLVVAC